MLGELTVLASPFRAQQADQRGKARKNRIKKWALPWRDEVLGLPAGDCKGLA